MKLYIVSTFLAFLALAAYIEPMNCKPLDAYGGQLPRYGMVNAFVEVRGGPRNEAEGLYTLTPGTRVQLRDSSRPDGAWVMIAPAEWMPLEAVCGY